MLCGVDPVAKMPGLKSGHDPPWLCSLGGSLPLRCIFCAARTTPGCRTEEPGCRVPGRGPDPRSRDSQV